MAFLFLPAGLAIAEAPAGVQKLAEAALEWESRGREDKAAESWERILRIQPHHADALRGVALARAAEGKTGEAQSLLNRLQKAAPNHPGVGQVKNRLNLGSRYRTLLAEARLNASTGKQAEALRSYKQLFGGHPPPPALALEYYRTVGGDEAEWEDARKGLDGLVARWPARRHRLARAEHLTYRPETREAGIKELQELAEEPGVGEQARRSWRRALLWLGTTPAEEALVAAYEQRFPEDAPIRQPAATEGESEGARPRNPEVNALMQQGLQAMAREEFPRAVTLFSRVQRLAPEEPYLWDRPLRSARFWALMQEAGRDRQEGKRREAREKFERARRLSAQEAPHAELALGQMDLEEDRLAEAEQRLRGLSEVEAVQVAALEALAEVVAKLGRLDEARALQERLAQLDPERKAAPGHLEAELLRYRARAATDAGNYDEAMAALERAHELNPQHPWVLNDLALLAMQLEAWEKARAAVDALLHLEPERPEVLRLHARVLAAEGEYERALQVLEALPKEEAGAQRSRLAVLAEIQRIETQFAQGETEDARRSLLLLQGSLRGEPELLGLVAQTWAEQGERERAVNLMVDSMAAAADPSAEMKLRAASVYLSSGAPERVPRLLRELEASRDLSGAEEAWLLDLRLGLAVQRADELREQGRTGAAFRQIEPLLREHPENSMLLAALGRLFQENGDMQEAHTTFLAALRSRPTDLDARQGALDTAAALQRRDEVRDLVEEGLRLHPRSPRMHLIAGRALIAIGDRGRGAELLEEGLRLSERDGAPVEERRLARESRPGEILEVAWARLGQRQNEPTQAASRERTARELQLELDRVEALRSVGVGAAGFGRYRSGEEGLGAVSELRAPVTISAPLGYAARLWFQATPTYLSAGTLGDESVEDFGPSDARFGFGPDGLRQRAMGTSLAVGLQGDFFQLDVGSTPLGFRFSSVVGGASWSAGFGDFGLRLGLERRAVTDSLLSYAGARLPRTGDEWGGVVRTGGNLSLGFDLNPAELYLYGGFDYLTGTRVADNRKFHAGAGVEWTLVEKRNQRFASGIGGDYFGYEKNLRYFTLGHGGYFSPQAFWRVGIPLKWRGTSGAVGWDVEGDVGVIWFREDGIEAFPLEPQREGAIGGYAGKDALSLAVNATPRLFVLLSERVSGGLMGDLHAARDYTEVTGGLFLELALDGATVREGTGWHRRLPVIR